MNNKLLILNLGVDSENTSLAFTQKWINDISINYDAVDVLTMKVGSTYQLNKNVNLFFINDQNTNYSKIYQLRKLNKLTRKLIKNNKDIGNSEMLAQYVRLRHRQTKRVLRFTDGLLQVFANDYPGLSSGRNFALNMLEILPPAKRMLLKRTAGLSGRFHGSPADCRSAPACDPSPNA